MFDNATSYSVYSEDAPQFKNIDKDTGDKQAFLKDVWFEMETI